jgi:hypothetical protein
LTRVLSDPRFTYDHTLVLWRELLRLTHPISLDKITMPHRHGMTMEENQLAHQACESNTYELLL